MKSKFFVTFFILIFMASNSEAYHLKCTYPVLSDLDDWETEYHLDDSDSWQSAGMACLNSGGSISGHLDWYDHLPNWW